MDLSKSAQIDRATSRNRRICPDTGKAPLPEDWRSSIEPLVAQGLGDGDVIYAIDTAMQSRADRTFNYCCGVFHRILEDRRAIARDLIEKGEE